MVTGTGQPIHRALGLTDGERDEVEAVLRRPPNHLELALFAVMWSEHCSYKSSRIHLRRLPTEAPHVLVGPGENAGVIDAGDGIAVAIRIESHNHPSAIEPYQGAATGVGGILRDIFTMGARPVAVMDPLFFGDPDEARQQWLIEGVVAGISGYGNSVGVPTVGGELTFNPCYAKNPLVNVLCMGVLPTDRLVLGQASGVGNLAVLLGSATGRDGIGGVSVLASAGFGAGERGTVAATPRRPSARASRWATPTRRSGSSRRASSSSMPSWWWASRTWAGPDWCAPPARPRPAAGWGWTSTSPQCPGGSRAWPPTR